jgi:type VI protein secretion system component Hcp
MKGIATTDMSNQRGAVTIMANRNTKTKGKKRAAVKDLKPKDVRKVKGGVTDFQFTKTTDKSSPTLLK